MRLPISFCLFILTAIVLVLQVFPWSGIFLMIMMGMFWSVVTLNAAFGAVVIDVANGRLGRIWLALPILWFGGYLFAAVTSHIEAAWLNGQIARTNSGKFTHFLPAKEALLIEPQFSYPGIAEQMLRSYALPVAFERRAGLREVSVTSWRLGNFETCQRIGSDANLRQLGFYSRKDLEESRAAPGLCIYSAPEHPPEPQLTVSIGKPQEALLSLASYRTQEIVIADGAGQSIALLAGSVAPLRWFPMPYMGCGLNSSAPAWECGAGFVRQPRRTLGVDGEFSPVPVIAKALGLIESPASERQKSADAPAAPSVDSIAATYVAQKFSEFDTLLAENPDKLSSPAALLLTRYPEFLGPRADGIVDSVDRSTARTRDASNMQRLIAALPSADFKRVGPRVLHVFEKNSDSRYLMYNNELLSRLGELGMPALPTLERYTKVSEGYLVAAALLGICRIGVPAAGTATAIVDAVLNNERMKIDGYQAAFVALRRLGRNDLADKVRSRVPFNKADSFSPWDEIRPESPADVCVAYDEAIDIKAGRR